MSSLPGAPSARPISVSWSLLWRFPSGPNFPSRETNHLPSFVISTPDLEPSESRDLSYSLLCPLLYQRSAWHIVGGKMWTCFVFPFCPQFPFLNVWVGPDGFLAWTLYTSTINEMTWLFWEVIGLSFQVSRCKEMAFNWYVRLGPCPFLQLTILFIFVGHSLCIRHFYIKASQQV